MLVISNDKCSWGDETSTSKTRYSKTRYWKPKTENWKPKTETEEFLDYCSIFEQLEARSGLITLLMKLTNNWYVLIYPKYEKSNLNPPCFLYSYIYIFTPISPYFHKLTYLISLFPISFSFSHRGRVPQVKDKASKPRFVFLFIFKMKKYTNSNYIM